MEHSGKASTKTLDSGWTGEGAGVQAGEELPEQADPLRECGEIAATRLRIAFSDALKVASEQLFARGASAAHEQRLWLEAADFTRNRREDMVNRFSQRFEQRYALACRRQSALLTGHVLDFDARRLRIVEHEVLENGLDPAPITEAIRNATWGPLHDLTKWFRDSLSDQELIPNDMPLGPGLIGGVVADALNEQFGSQETKQRLLRALCRTLPEPVDRIYRDLLGHLAGAKPVSDDISDDISDEAPDADEEPVTMDRGATAAGGFPDAPWEDAAPCNDAQAGGVMADASGDGSDGKADSEVDSEAGADASAAKEAIGLRLASKRLPGFIVDFLTGPWQTLLAGIHRKHGPSSPEWDAALGTMDDLVWSLRSKRVPEERARMMGVLPDLVKRLGRGLEAQPSESHHRFFARLADCHVRILGASRPVAAPSAPTSAPTFAPTPAPAERAPQEQQAPTEESLLADLEAGVWLEFRAPYFSAPRKLKLAWISPNRNLFLLTNHLGERALSLGSRDLASLLWEGGARIVSMPDSKRPGDAVPPAPQVKKTA